MKVCHYFVMDSVKMGGGIATSAKQQRKALDRNNVEWTSDPSEDYDILHLNTFSPFSLYHLFKAKMKGKKTVFHAHTTVKDFRGSFKFSNILAPVYRKITTTVYNSVDKLIAPSKYAEEIVRDQGVDNDIVVLTNGFDDEKLEGTSQMREQTREKYDLEGFTVVNLAGVFERKGLDDFIAVAKELEDVEFVWMGKIPSLAPRETKNKIEASPDNVTFTGFVDDPREAFAVGDVFFFPSKEETQGIAILESAYCGLPLVVRDLPAYEHWLEDGVNCLKSDNVEGFIESIEKLRQDEGLKNDISNGAKKESERHTLEQVGTRLEEIYRELTVS